MSLDGRTAELIANWSVDRCELPALPGVSREGSSRSRGGRPGSGGGRRSGEDGEAGCCCENGQVHGKSPWIGCLRGDRIERRVRMPLRTR